MSKSSVAARIRVELLSWASLAFMLALIEGGVMGVLIKNGFSGKVSDLTLNLAVAIATGAPYYSNLLSFVWVKLSHGRHKARLVSNLGIICCFCTLIISQIPMTTLGLVILLLLLITARFCWSGIMTVRSTIWRVNYPRYIRGRVTARLATLTAFLMSLSAFSAGWVLDWQFSAFPWLYGSFALFSLTGAYYYRKLSVRHQKKSLHREKSESQSLSFVQVFKVLAENKPFARYMLAMFILGTGNLMFMAPFIVFLNEHTELTRTSQILLTTAIPLALIPFAVGWWAKLLDGNHIFYFRAVHSWGFVLALATYTLAQVTDITLLYYIGACIYGIAVSGGVIGWNLGHNDFVGKASPMEYMAVHVTLTGIRGAIAPIVGISFYQWLESVAPGNGQYALILPLCLSTTGGILFVYFNRQRVMGKLVNTQTP